MGWWGYALLAVRRSRAEGVYADVEASTAIYKAADRPIEGSPLNREVTALLRVPVVPSDFGRLMSGYRHTINSTALLQVPTVVWYGVVWYGTVRYGTARYGMVWYQGMTWGSTGLIKLLIVNSVCAMCNVQRQPAVRGCG